MLDNFQTKQNADSDSTSNLLKNNDLPLFEKLNKKRLYYSYFRVDQKYYILAFAEKDFKRDFYINFKYNSRIIFPKAETTFF